MTGAKPLLQDNVSLRVPWRILQIYRQESSTEGHTAGQLNELNPWGEQVARAVMQLHSTEVERIAESGQSDRSNYAIGPQVREEPGIGIHIRW